MASINNGLISDQKTPSTDPLYLLCTSRLASARIVARWCQIDAESAKGDMDEVDVGPERSIKLLSWAGVAGVCPDGPCIGAFKR